MRINTRGCNRLVVLTRRWAIKIPRPTSWHAFLCGIINNCNEAAWSHKPGACPVVHRGIGGLWIVMPRCEPVPDDFDPAEWRGEVRVEQKRDSFGVLNGEIVAVDYGW